MIETLYRCPVCGSTETPTSHHLRIPLYATRSRIQRGLGPERFRRLSQVPGLQLRVVGQ